jgi:hypothetical protein
MRKSGFPCAGDNRCDFTCNFGEDDAMKWLGSNLVPMMKPKDFE